jgi:hypothetical protein
LPERGSECGRLVDILAIPGREFGALYLPRFAINPAALAIADNLIDAAAFAVRQSGPCRPIR